MTEESVADVIEMINKLKETKASVVAEVDLITYENLTVHSNNSGMPIEEIAGICLSMGLEILNAEVMKRCIRGEEER